MPPFISRFEAFDRVDSTNDVVRGWLAAGEPEVCVAVSDEQTAGRGRADRSWTAPPGVALLCTLGFRPGWLAPEQLWQLGAIVALSMAEAGEAVAALEPGTIRLKWPNDLVVESRARAGANGGVRKLAGVLGETEGVGGPEPRAVVGIGVNVAWRRADFPPEIAPAMTSLAEVAEVAEGRVVERAGLLAAFLERLEPRLESLRRGAFDGQTWAARQLTNGRPVRLELPDGRGETRLAVDVDPVSGALLVADDSAADGLRPVLVGEIRHLRLGAVL